MNNKLLKRRVKKILLLLNIVCGFICIEMIASAGEPVLHTRMQKMQMQLAAHDNEVYARIMKMENVYDRNKQLESRYQLLLNKQSKQDRERKKAIGKEMKEPEFRIYFARLLDKKHPTKKLAISHSTNSKDLHLACVRVAEKETRIDLQELKKIAAKEWKVTELIQLLYLGYAIDMNGVYSFDVDWRGGRLNGPNVYLASKALNCFLVLDEEEDHAFDKKIRLAGDLDKPTTKQRRKAILKAHCDQNKKPKLLKPQNNEYTLTASRYKPNSQKQLRAQKHAIKALKKYRNSYVQNLKIKHLLTLDPTVVSKKNCK